MVSVKRKQRVACWPGEVEITHARWVLVGLVAASACRFQDLTPGGTRRDIGISAVQAVVGGAC